MPNLMSKKLSIDLFHGGHLTYAQLKTVHGILVGSQDYIDSNVIYNIDMKDPVVMVDICGTKEPEVVKERLHKIIDYLFIANEQKTD